MVFENSRDIAAAARRLVGALFVALAAGESAAQAAPPAPTAAMAPYRARLLGVFNFDTGDAIEGAEVSDVMTHTTALTTRTGTVTLSFLPDGGSLVRIQKLGFAPTTIMVAISAVDTVPFTILLKPITQTLPAVVTKDSAPNHLSPGLQAFEQRRARGLGRFMTAAELRKNDNRTMTNVIRSLGVNVSCTKSFPIRCFATSSRVSGKFCDLDVYVDGIRSSPDERDLEKMRVDQHGAIEAYVGPSSIPTEYNMTGSLCGVLLFWTRER